MTLTEDQQAEALRRIRRAVTAVERAEAERAEALEFARSVGVSVARIAEVANTTRSKVYGWGKAARPDE